VAAVRRPWRPEPALDAASLGDARGQLPAWRTLTTVERELDPVELGQHVVGHVEAAVVADVALDSAQERERRQPLVGRGDLLSLPAQGVPVQPGETPTFGVWSQMAR
jgi:hypothetical protein